MRQKNAIALIVIIVLCFVSRLPQLLSNNLILDGDECVLGLMAKHMLAGKGIPVFFYGQAYGFSLIETSFISIAYLIGGYGDMSVKIAMLTLWTTGLIFFYKTLRCICRAGSMLPLLIVLLLIFTPAWGIWSMKARGGYLTAFTLSWIFTYLILDDNKQKPVYYILAGLIPPVIFMSQAFWLPGLLPFIIFWLFKKAQLKQLGWFIAALALSAILLAWAVHNTTDYWHPDVVDIHNIKTNDPKKIYHLIFNNLQAYYYLALLYAPPLSNVIFAKSLIAVSILLLVPGTWFALKMFRRDPLCLAAIFSIIFSIAYLLLTNGVISRYALPFSGYLIFAMAIYLDRINKKMLTATVLLPLYITGAIAICLFKNYEFSNTSKADLKQFISHLEQENIHHVFCMRGLLLWQILFYSNEHIISRYYQLQDRYPEYVEKVNKAFREGKRTAVIGYDDDLAPNDIPLIRLNHYFLYPDPSKDMLQKLEFVL